MRKMTESAVSFGLSFGGGQSTKLGNRAEDLARYGMVLGDEPEGDY